MTKSFGFGALIQYLKYEIVIRYLCLLLNGKVGVFLHGNDWDTFSDKNVMNLGGYILAKLIFTLSQNPKSQTKGWYSLKLFTWSTLSVSLTDSE